jgi:two-component system, chemotaxis family, CheB/CheR fusion protein
MADNFSNLALEVGAYKKANLAICIVDESGMYTSVNDKYAELFGYTPSELVGNSFLTIVPKEDALRTEALYKEIIQKDDLEMELSVSRLKKDGSLLRLLTTYKLLIEGEKRFIIATAKDMTEQRALEEKQALQQQLLLQQSKMMALAEMISAVAHQWRQPLNALGIMIQDIKIAKRFNELTDDYLFNFDKSAMAQINMMSKTIDDFRNFFKPDTEKERFALIGATLDVVSLIRPQLEHYGIAIDVYSPLDIDEPGEAAIFGYPNEFKQLVLNLVSNAKDAIIERHLQEGKVFGGAINIEIGIKNEDGKRIAFVKIKDNGAGIKEEILPRIFEPYFTTKEQGKGTGVGLYMTKMIIEQNMGGTVVASSSKDGETVFEMMFEEGNSVFA